MSSKLTITALTVGLIGASLGLPQHAPAADGDLQQAAARQEQIRGDARQLGGRLDDMLAEFTRNGITDGQDYQILKGVRSILGSLSDKEMAEVVTLLKQAVAANAANPANGSSQQVVQAYTGQKNISLRLKQILAAHQREQDMDTLANSVSDLAVRQGTNLSTAFDLNKLAAQTNKNEAQAAMDTSRQAQQSEQNDIGGEVKLLADKLTALAQSSGDAKAKDAAAQLTAVEPISAAASDALGGSRMNDAIAGETSAREQLTKIARGLAAAGAGHGAAGQDASQLASLAQEERDLADQTRKESDELARLQKGATPEGMEKEYQEQIKRDHGHVITELAKEGITAASTEAQIKATPEMQKYLKDHADWLKKLIGDQQQKIAQQAQIQAAIAAKTQIVRDDMAKSAKDAAAAMDNAAAQMTAAQNALSRQDGAQAIPSEQDAANQLDAAAKAAQQSASATAQAQPQNKEQALEQMQKAVGALAQKENASLQQNDAQKTGPQAATAAAAQRAMADQARDLQQAANAQNNPGAQAALQQAAAAMENAAQAMQNGGMPNIAQANQQAAAQDLAAAQQQLGQQAAAQQQEQKELTALQKDMQDIARLILEQQQVIAVTEKDIAAKKTLQRNAKELAYKQGAVQQDTTRVQQGLSAASPNAAQSLTEAATDMADAVAQLTSTGVPDGLPPEKQALAALFKAQDSLAGQIQQLAQDLGQQQVQQAAQAAQQALQNAENQLQNAANDAGQGQDQQAQGALGQAGQQMAQAAGQPQNMPGAAQNDIRQAQQAAADAAAAAAAGDNQQAQADAQQAAQDLAAAQSAMTQAQAGVGDLAQPDGGQGQQQAQGQGQGQQQGQGQGQGQQPGQGQSQSNQSSTSQSGKGSSNGERNFQEDGGAVQRGLQAAKGSGRFLGLPDRDRPALQQSQSEKYPQEYGAMIEEYMRSLASDSTTK